MPVLSLACVALCVLGVLTEVIPGLLRVEFAGFCVEAAMREHPSAQRTREILLEHGSTFSSPPTSEPLLNPLRSFCVARFLLVRATGLSCLACLGALAAGIIFAAPFLESSTAYRFGYLLAEILFSSGLLPSVLFLGLPFAVGSLLRHEFEGSTSIFKLRARGGSEGSNLPVHAEIAKTREQHQSDVRRPTPCVKAETPTIVELRHTLLVRVLHNQQTADRLIAFERERDPLATEREWILSAIDRLERDNR